MSNDPIESLDEPTLSARELELVQLLGRGLSNREIARELVISPNTVKVHLRNIYAKLEVSSRTEATMAAVRMGWIAVPAPQQESQAPQKSVAAQAETVDGPSVPVLAPQRPVPSPAAPLALWQQIHLVASALLVALGIWLTWPDQGERPGPFTDRPTLAASQLSDSVSRWRALAQMPTPRARLAVVADQKQIYALGGVSLSGTTGLVEIYTPDTDLWQRGTDMPIPVANVGAAVLGSHVYIPGGSTADDKISDLLQVYEPDDEGGTWTSAARLPKGRSAYAIAAHADAFYLFGGWDGRSYVTETLKYDPKADVWVPCAPMATPRAFAGAGTVGGRIYVVGGFDDSGELDTCEVYDPATDAWTECPHLNVPRGGVGVAVVADTLYVIGGGWQSYLVENEFLSATDPSTGETWSTFPSPLLQEWRNLGVAAHGTSIYAIGGWDGSFLSTHQAYRALFQLFLPSMPSGDKG